MKRSVSLLMIFVICISLTTLLQKAEVYAKPVNDGIKIEVQGGFDGVAKLGAWSPVTVKVSSLNRDISGEIEVEIFIDPERKMIFSEPVELIAGTEQEVNFEIPVVTAKKEVEIRLNEKKKTLAEQTYTYKRLLPPEVVLIGVLSEDAEAFRWMNGRTVLMADNPDIKEKVDTIIRSGLIYNAPVLDKTILENYYQKHEAVVVPLNRNSFPDTKETMYGFDIILIAKFDTSLLNDDQISVLDEWLKSGGMMIVGTGDSWQKVYSGLPDDLKPFPIKNTINVQAADMIESFTGLNETNTNLKIATGDPGNKIISGNDDGVLYRNYIIAGDENYPLVLRYKIDDGTMVVLTFDPSVEPFVSWDSKSFFMDNVFLLANPGFNLRFYEENENYYSIYQDYGNSMSNMVTYLPNEKVPPFKTMLIILGIYIVLVGPVLYTVLKIKDKRDLAWVLIPVMSLLFFFGMYVFGFKTRYNSAIVNTVSVFEIKPGAKEASVSSTIGVFNDRQGTLTVEYDRDSGIREAIPANDRYSRYSEPDSEGQVVAKLTDGERIKLERYNTSLWTPSIIYASRTVPFDSDIFKNIKVKDGTLQGSIENTTPYDLLDTVLVVGKRIIRVGDIVSGDSVFLNVTLDGTEVYRQPDEYLKAVYGETYYPRRKDYPENYSELYQRRMIFEDSLIQAFSNNEMEIALLAMNEQELDYGMSVNSKEPMKYFKNLIVWKAPIYFTPGQEVEIPGGMITPNIYQSKTVAESYYMGDDLLRIIDSGSMEFEFILPDKLNVKEIRLRTDNYMLIMKGQVKQGPYGKTGLLSNEYHFYLFNAVTQEWEEIKSDFTENVIFDKTISENVSQYIGPLNDVRLRIDVTELNSSNPEDIITLPEIYVKGVSK